ncbi:MAG TPA: type VI secretion system protein TssA [Terrimicrobiaceae bacterium]
MISIEELLRPVSPEKPCGDDPSYDPDFRELDAIIRGKPETKEDERPKEPDWNRLEEQCLKVLSRSKHLYVAVALSLAWLKTQGLPGFRNGIALVRGLLEQYWDPVYPRLDPEDGNDPTERVNIVAALCAPPGTLGDSMRFIVRIRHAPLCRSQKVQVSASDIINAETGGAGAKSIAEIESGFKQAAPADVQATLGALAETLLHVKEIDAFLTRSAGPRYDRSWNPLIETVEDVQRRLVRYAPELQAKAGSEEVISQASTSENVKIGSPSAGSIGSRPDVLRTLDMICKYYEHAEPSSPVPLLLRRAQRLVGKDFVQIVNDLTPDSLGPLRVITGENASEASTSGENV